MMKNLNDGCLTSCLFQEPWWLDAVAPTKWKEVTVEENGRIIGRMPFVPIKRMGMHYIVQPPFTKFLGPTLAPFSGKLANRYSYEKQVTYSLIESLPNFDEIKFELHYDINNWQPYYWKNFSQSTYYSYVIDDLSDLSSIYAGFRSQKRTDISKASRRVFVTDDYSPVDLFNHHKSTLAREGKLISYDCETLVRIYSAAFVRDSGRIFCAKDDAGRVHAAICIVWDSRSAYYLINSIEPDLRSSGAATLLVWEAIKHCSTRTKSFDFEGSMIEPVANSYRAFGACLKPYSMLCRTDSLALRLRNALNSIKN
jgi:hypothetical protein